MKKMLRSVALPPGMDSKVFAVISALRAEAYDEIHAIEPYTIEGAITALQNSIITIEDDIDVIQSDVSTVQGDISTIDGQITTINNTLTSLDATNLANFLDYFLEYLTDETGGYLVDATGGRAISMRL
jgi:prophage DNA circulation protein